MTGHALKKIRVAVGTADQLLSSVWFFSGNKGCLFIGAVGLGGTLKASFHESGKSHIRFGPDIKELSSAYVTKWQRPTTPPAGAVHVASIFFPTNFLKGTTAIPKNVPTLIRLERAPSGSAIELGLFYSREPMNELEPKLAKVGLPMVHIGLESGEGVSIVASQRTFDPTRLGPMAALADENGSLPLPPPKWIADEAKSASSIGNLSSILINEPSNQGGILQLVQVSGLRIVNGKKSAA